MTSLIQTTADSVLIVDDEADIRELYAQIIQGMGIPVISVADGQSALDVLAASPAPFLILADFRMPGLNGLELCQAVRAKLPEVPYVLVSGFVDKDVAVGGVQQGLTSILEKPFEPEKLQKLVRQYADERKERLAKEARESEEITLLFIEEAAGLLGDLEKHILRLEDEPIDPAVVDLLFRNVHSVKGGAAAIPGGQWLAQLGHSFESCLSMIKNGKIRLDATGMELFLLTSDFCQQLLQLIRQKEEPKPDLAEAIQLCIRSLDAIKTGKTVAAPASAPVAEKSTSSKNSSEEKKDAPADEGVWVSNEKLDSFMRLSGELIVLKNYFQVLNQDPDLRAISGRMRGKVTDFTYSLNKITDTLQDQIMSIRKVTLERALSKLPRIFRQVTKEVNKKVRLNTEGFDLGVDRTIANALSICMTHMLRNAIDHGIESAEARQASGKPAEGTITISTREQKGVIQVTISDDGGGINRERVLQKAIDKGLLEEHKRKTLTEAETYDLLFLPGFSTAEKVTGISGRGVGMDVVKTEILNLKGRVRVESKLGAGTTFHVEVPVPKTVMVEQTLLLKSLETMIAVPLNAIAQLTSCTALPTSVVGHQMTCQFQGKTIPLRTFEEISSQFHETNEPPAQRNATSQSVVVLQSKDDYLGLLVDGIQDQLEAVIRPFDKITQSFPGFKGTTVLGDDSIAYVVAPEDFVTLGLGLKPAAKEAA